jgi:hypothetical protein
MPVETIVAMIVIVFVFGTFGAVLAWADAQTRSLKRH